MVTYSILYTKKMQKYQKDVIHDSKGMAVDINIPAIIAIIRMD